MKNSGSYSEPKFRLPFILSIAVHIAIIVGLIVVAPVTSYRLNSDAANLQPVVHAAVIDAAQVAAQVQTLQSQEAQKKAAEEERVQALQAQAEAARQAKIAEEQRLAQIKVDQQKAQQQTQLATQQTQAEQQRLAQLKAQQLQQAQALALAQKQQQALQAKAAELKKQQAQEAAHAKALAAAKQKQAELAAKQTALQQQLMQQQITNEQQQLVKAQQMQGVINQYRARILMSIGSQWLIPEGIDPTISCVFTLDVTPAGVVSHAQLIRSSGNAALDRAAETAIYKASPLPVPKDPAVFAPFRHFTLKMTPQDIAHN